MPTGSTDETFASRAAASSQVHRRSDHTLVQLQVPSWTQRQLQFEILLRGVRRSLAAVLVEILLPGVRRSLAAVCLKSSFMGVRRHLLQFFEILLRGVQIAFDC